MTHGNIPEYTAIPLPFAYFGETEVATPELDPFTDPAEEAEGKNFFDSRWSWDLGLGTPPAYAYPPTRVITRQLMNRLFAQISGRQFLHQCGALDTFDQNVCDAIGGYPQGAVLQYLHDDILYDVVSLRDNNYVDYMKKGIDGTNWKFYGSSIFTYMFPDYGTVNTAEQNNILKEWTISSGSGVISDVLSITSACWIQSYISNPAPMFGTTNYESGIILYGGTSPLPTISGSQDLETFINENTLYTTYELFEKGSLATPVLPVLPGTKIAAFSTQSLPSGSSPYKIVIRKLTPTRTR